MKKFPAFRTRMRIYYVRTPKRSGYVRAFDSAALDNLLTGYGFKNYSIRRAPGQSKKAISVMDFALGR